MTERVLITGARSAAALDLARDFRALGFEPHLADCSPAWIARLSRRVEAVHRYPSPVFDPSGFRAAIAALALRLSPRLIVPACEEVFHLAAPSLRPAIGSRLYAPRLETLRRLHDKLAFAEACGDWSLPVPQTQVLGDRDRYAANSTEWVFKPRFTRFGESALIGPSAAQLAALHVPAGQGWIAQRRVRGTEVCFHAAASHGRVTAFAAYRSAWRMGGGASFAFDTVSAERSQQLFSIAQTLAAAAMITGQFACDAIIDAQGQPWLIECNPRATSGVHLLTGDGLLASAILGNRDQVHAPSAAPAHLAPAMLVYGLPMAVGEGRLAEWCQAMSAGRDVLARPGDRLPLLGALRDAAQFAFTGRRRGISATAATTRDIEWNGEDLP
ncbi:ATP-grasp domain-containing protein [Novosphingobium sp.]|uniref:ATP-grasp domain-containing protein n=1 Tax=Novosphingobium sp. TaxID=1874826 RepID=UPI0025E88D1A|nr:ATP-grasp domain-containing protein [Novosphingobium sp.]